MSDSTHEAAEELYEISARNPDKESAIEEFELWIEAFREMLFEEINGTDKS